MNRYKSILKYALTFISCFTVFSCSNFLSGSNLRDEIKAEVERANSSSATILTAVKNVNQGRITPGKEETYKIVDKVEISFEKDPGYEFVEFEVLSKHTYQPLVNVIRFSPVMQFSDGAHKIYKTTATILQARNDILIRPKCIALNDTVAPVFVDYSDSESNTFDFRIYSNKNEELISTKPFDGSNNVLWTDSQFRTNHLNSVKFNFFCAEDENEIEALIVKETLVKSVEGNDVGTVFEKEVAASDLSLTKVDDTGIFSGACKYEFCTPDDGLVKLDFILKDTAGNKSEALKTFYVLKDTKISGLQTEVYPRNCLNDGTNPLMYDLKDAPGNLEKILSLSTFSKIYDYLEVSENVTSDIWFVNGPKTYKDDFTVEYFASNDEGKTYIPVEVIDAPLPLANHTNRVIPMKDSDGNVVISRNKKILIKIVATDSAGNTINKMFGDNFKYSNVPIMASCTCTNHEDTSLTRKIKFTNGKSEPASSKYVCFAQTESNGKKVTTVKFDDSGTFPIKDNTTYYIYCFSSYPTGDGDSSYGMPSDLVVYKKNQICMYNVQTTSGSFCETPKYSAGTERGTISISTNVYNSREYSIVFLQYGDIYASAEPTGLTNGTIVKLDNIPLSYVSSDKVLKVHAIWNGTGPVKINGSKVLRAGVKNEKSFNSLSVDTTQDTEKPLLVESAYEDDSVTKKVYWSLDGTGRLFNFRIIDNKSISNNTVCKVFYSTFSTNRTNEEIFNLNCKNVAVAASNTTISDGTYKNYYYKDVSVDLSDLGDTRYILYLYVKDAAGNETIQEVNLNLSVTETIVPSKVSKNCSWNDASGDIYSNINFVWDVSSQKWIEEYTYKKNKSGSSDPEKIAEYSTDNLFKCSYAYKDLIYSPSNMPEYNYAYPFYYYSSTTPSKIYGLEWNDASILLVYADAPVFMETLYSDNDLGTDPKYWCRHVFESNKINRLILKPTTDGTNAIFAYDSKYNEIPKGKYYCVVAHYADGTSLMSDVKYK